MWRMWSGLHTKEVNFHQASHESLLVFWFWLMQTVPHLLNSNLAFFSSRVLIATRNQHSVFLFSSVVIHKCPSLGTHKQEMYQHRKYHLWRHHKPLLHLPHKQLTLHQHRHPNHSQPNHSQPNHSQPNHRQMTMFKLMLMLDPCLMMKKMKTMQTEIGLTRSILSVV